MIRGCPDLIVVVSWVLHSMNMTGADFVFCYSPTVTDAVQKISNQRHCFEIRVFLEIFFNVLHCFPTVQMLGGWDRWDKPTIYLGWNAL